jgi:hypothetical protein
MNVVRMRYAGHLPRKRFGLLKRDQFGFQRWGDGFWGGLGYWKERERKGSQL